MAYKTIFGTKPKSSNKNEFCCRIVKLLNEIEFCNNGSIFNNGKVMLNVMFKFSELNNGYIGIDDLLEELDKSYSNIFELTNVSNDSIEEDEILANIDIIVNCIYRFKPTDYRCFYNKNKAYEIIAILMKAIDEFLLGIGYVLQYDNEKNQLFIVENDISIDTTVIDDEKLKSEIISFYNYRNADNINEKKKILLILIGELESKKACIEKVLGNKIGDMFSNYANNFNIRHNNIDKNYKKYYNEKIANLSNEEFVKWYNYIFAFMINIYMNLNDLNDVNINDGYK